MLKRFCKNLYINRNGISQIWEQATIGYYEVEVERHGICPMGVGLHGCILGVDLPNKRKN